MYDYFYGQQNEQYQFLQLPMMLIKEPEFKKLSSDAKILYSLLLNRTSLSSKNDWRDEQGRVYIYFTIEEIIEDLNCGRDKAIKSMKELKDIKLIESVRQGLGKPNIIYVKNFATSLKYTPNNPVNSRKSENPTSRKSENPTSGNRNDRSQKVGFSDSIYTDINDIDIRHTESSQSQSQSHAQAEVSEEKNDMTLTKTLTKTLTMTPDTSDNKNINLENPRTSVSKNADPPKYDANKYAAYEQIIKENIEYDLLNKYTRAELEMIDGLVQIMLDVIFTESPVTVKIGKETKHREIVKSVYLKLNSSHIEHIISQYKAQHHKITNKTAYLRTMLYTVFSEIEAHYVNEVRADGLVW